MSGIVLISDLHFANHTAFGHIDPKAEFVGCNSRFHEIAKVYRAAVDYAEENDCESIFILGDIFHDRGQIDIPVYNAVYQLFKETAGKGIRLVVFPGNHDCLDLRAMHVDKHLHSLFAFEKLAFIFEKPSIVQTAYFPIAVVPYSNSGREIITATNTLADKMTGDIKTIMFHHSFNEAITGPAEWVMGHALDAKDLSEKFTHKFSGHYHLHQKVTGNLWYVGTPIQHNFGERKYNEGFIHLLPDGSWRHIENIVSPRFQVITTSDPKDLENLSVTDYISVKWEGSIGDIDKLKDTVPENCVIEYSSSGKGTTFLTRTSIKTTDAVEDMIETYAKNKYPVSGMPGMVEDENNIIEHGKNLYKGK
jgi:DNA repair exonuclease SbcCD nuclease subunit